MATSESGGRLLQRFARDLVEGTLDDTPVTGACGREASRQEHARTRGSRRSRRTLVEHLDATAVFEAARADPGAFCPTGARTVGIDEVQRVPAHPRHQGCRQRGPQKLGRFLITGSANLLDLPGRRKASPDGRKPWRSTASAKEKLAGRREGFIDGLLSGDSTAFSNSPGTLSRADYLEILCAGKPHPDQPDRAPPRRLVDKQLSATDLEFATPTTSAGSCTSTGFHPGQVACCEQRGRTRKGKGRNGPSASPRPASSPTSTSLRRFISSKSSRPGATT